MDNGKKLLGYKVINNQKTEWVVFLHGFGGNSNAFKKQIEDYSKAYNILLIDMYGHGLSVDNPMHLMVDRSFTTATEGVLLVLDYLGIEKAHFVGLSLGTFIIPCIAETAPKRIISAIMCGAITEYGIGVKSIFTAGNLFRDAVPYMFLYKIFAYILMPRNNHKKSRSIFVQEAVKLGKPEFFAWFDMLQNYDVVKMTKKFNSTFIPKLYISGMQDHMFVGLVKKNTAPDKNAVFYPVPNCGHICNIDRADVFNNVTLQYLKNGYLDASQNAV